MSMTRVFRFRALGRTLLVALLCCLGFVASAPAAVASAPAEHLTSGVAQVVPISVGVAALLVVGAVLLWWGRRRKPATSPFSLPRSVFAAAHEETESTVRDQAREYVVRLGEELAEHTGPGPAGARDSAPNPSRTQDPDAVRRALDAYTAASTVLDRARDLPDLAGVLALVEEGQHAVRVARSGGPGKSQPAASNKKKRRRKREEYADSRPSETADGLLCFFDPLHGSADKRVNWRPLGQREALSVAACRECRREVRERRAPRVLTARHEEREVPYFEVPAERSLWAATGYGSISAEPLAVHVQRGEFTRAAAARDRAT